MKLMKPFTKTVSVIFGIIALLHLLRLIFHIGIVVGNFQLPLMVSLGGFVVTAILCIGLWKEANRRP